MWTGSHDYYSICCCATYFVFFFYLFLSERLASPRWYYPQSHHMSFLLSVIYFSFLTIISSSLPEASNSNSGSKQDADGVSRYAFSLLLSIILSSLVDTLFLFRSLIWGRRFIPYFIVEFDSVLQRVILFEGVVGSRKLLHSSSNSESCRFCLALRNGSAGDTTAHISLSGRLFLN